MANVRDALERLSSERIHSFPSPLLSFSKTRVIKIVKIRMTLKGRNARNVCNKRFFGQNATRSFIAEKRTGGEQNLEHGRLRNSPST